MSDFSLTLVLQIKTSKIINDMAKVQIHGDFRYHSTITKECRPSVMKYISPDLHALLWCEIEFPVGHVEKPVPVVEECHDDIDAVLGE